MKGITVELGMTLSIGDIIVTITMEEIEQLRKMAIYSKAALVGNDAHISKAPQVAKTVADTFERICPVETKIPMDYKFVERGGVVICEVNIPTLGWFNIEQLITTFNQCVINGKVTI